MAMKDRHRIFATLHYAQLEAESYVRLQLGDVESADKIHAKVEEALQVLRDIGKNELDKAFPGIHEFYDGKGYD